MTNPIKVLVAEDDKLLNQLLSREVKNAGYTVLSAFDGDEALAMAGVNHPDIILLDLIMPVKTGFEVLDELKKNEKLKNIPVIVLSNLGQGEDMETATRLGAKGFLVKADSSTSTIIAKMEEVLKA